MCRQNNDYLELVKKPSAADATEALATGETLQRTDYAKGFYDDGITYKWENGIKPRHIRFETMAGSSILDQCDVHMYSLQPDPDNTDIQGGANKDARFLNPPGPNGFKKVPNSDIFLFRLGYFDYLKLNVESMIMPYFADQWYTIDLIIDWSEQQVSIYVNDNGLSKQPFFLLRAMTFENANALSLYGLSPGSTSKFRNLQVCEHTCSVQGGK